MKTVNNIKRIAIIAKKILQNAGYQNAINGGELNEMSNQAKKKQQKRVRI